MLQVPAIRPRLAQPVRAQGEESISGQTAEEETDEETSAPLASKFGSKFASVLQSALERSGGETALFNKDSLAGGREPEPP